MKETTEKRPIGRPRKLVHDPAAKRCKCVDCRRERGEVAPKKSAVIPPMAPVQTADPEHIEYLDSLLGDANEEDRTLP